MATRMDVGFVEVSVGSERAAPWPVHWTPIWVGALSAVTAALIGGLLGIAFRAFEIAPAGRIGAEHPGVPELVASVCIGFFAFVIAGWVAARLAGLQRAEPAMLHGAISWLVAVPIVVVLMALGARSDFGSWYGGLVGAPPWVTSAAPVTAKAAREAAGGAATALLLGLVGAVLGGWMGSGEPMTFTHHLRRQQLNR